MLLDVMTEARCALMLLDVMTESRCALMLLRSYITLTERGSPFMAVVVGRLSSVTNLQPFYTQRRRQRRQQNQFSLFARAGTYARPLVRTSWYVRAPAGTYARPLVRTRARWHVRAGTYERARL